MGTSRKRSIYPDNVSGLDANNDLVTDAGLIKLVAEPSLYQFLCSLISFVVDKKMSAINGNKTSVFSIPDQSIRPNDLHRQKFVLANRGSSNVLDTTTLHTMQW